MTDEATQSGFPLTFTYSVETGSTKPTSVRVYGNKTVENKQVNVNGEITSANSSIQFQGMDYDSSIANAIISELQAIFNTDINE